jgi:hypothetical protein
MLWLLQGLGLDGFFGTICKSRTEKTTLSPRLKWEDNIDAAFRKMWRKGVDWIAVAQDRIQ